MRPDGLLLLAANRYRDREVAAGWLVRWRLRIGARGTTGTPVNEALVRDLASGAFLAEQRNAVLIGGLEAEA